MGLDSSLRHSIGRLGSRRQYAAPALGGNLQPGSLDITPSTKVLLALTHTVLKPLDALCELIDNGLDSFRAAEIRGTPVPHPLLEITVPGETQARRGEGIVRVVDNGIGLDREGLANTIRAGFSGNNKYDSLGLFGMGFNIATGKLGRRTSLITARRGDSTALRVIIDLPSVVSSNTFSVPVEEIEKPANFDHGTIVEVSSWWPGGDPNAGFALELAQISKNQLRQQIGRRYASMLRHEEAHARITLNQEVVTPFEHCVWSGNRFVERQGWGMIPARIELDATIYSQRRCVVDGTVLDPGVTECLACGSEESRTVEERVRGWVGIQRFDDNNKFGIDLIRNGRAIRVGEKDAFFNHLGDLGEAIKEYPTDQQTGRIVGEIHLDHIPVDFSKQDFQRTTEEWYRAIAFVRGGSLLPSNWDDRQRNETPVSKLFQGYRKVRNYGRADMYMGRYDIVAGKATRIGREVEAELYRRFLNRESGFYSDENWWELVQNATTPPLVALEECATCGFQNSPGVDECADCGVLIRSKVCVTCARDIRLSATLCPHCGSSQIPEVQEPWRCEICKATNAVEDERCGTCDTLRGVENPLSPEVLRRDAELLPELSFDGRTFVMSDGRRTEPLSVQTFRSSVLRPVWNGGNIPTVALRTSGRIEIYLDDTHAIFTQLGIRAPEAVAVEAAQYLYNLRSDLVGRPGHSVQNISAQILADIWGETLSVVPEHVSDAIRLFFGSLTERLEDNADAADFYEELDLFDQRELADQLISNGLLDELPRLRANGGFLRYSKPGVLSKFFARSPDGWFGSVWTDRLPSAADVGEGAASSAREQLVGIYSRCLDDCAAYARFNYPDRLIVARAQASLQYLEAHLV